MEILPIIDEQGNVVGSEERSVVHEKGLLHPEVHVLILLSNGNFVFQRRSMSKDTNPGKLTLSVAGHVSYGQSPEEAAIRELEEETGITVSREELLFLGTVRTEKRDETTRVVNNSLKYFYGLKFSGAVSDLRIEPGDGEGFEEYSLKDLMSFTAESRKEFVTVIFHEAVLSFFERMLTI